MPHECHLVTTCYGLARENVYKTHDSSSSEKLGIFLHTVFFSQKINKNTKFRTKTTPHFAFHPKKVFHKFFFWCIVFFLADTFRETIQLFLHATLFSVLSLLLSAIVAPTEWKSDLIADQDSGAVLANGFIFNHVTTILSAEKFITVDFLVPFPKFDINVSADLGAYIEKLGKLWSHPSWECHLDYSSDFQKNDSTVDIHWLLHHVRNEVRIAKHELIALRNYTSSFLNTPHGTASGHNRPPRAAPLAMMLLASIGLFGSRNALGAGHCGLTEIFGSCQERAKQNAANIKQIAKFNESLAEDVFKVRSDVNDKFFLGTTELAAPKYVQKEMLEIENCNWKIIGDNFEIFEHNFHVLRECDQLLFSRQQVIFNNDTNSALQAVTFANIKSYTKDLFTYWVNLMKSIQPMLNHYLPLLLLPKQSLLKI